MSEESDESKSRYWPKTLFWAKFGPKWTKFGPGKFFYAPGPPVSARYHYCLSEVVVVVVVIIYLDLKVK